MNIQGAKFKEVRKAKKISQAELSRGICTQATVSNIESKNVCDSLDIFSKLCIRLGQEVQTFLVPSAEEETGKILAAVEEYCLASDYKKAFALLKEDSLSVSEMNALLFSKYNYYMGLTYLLEMKNQEEAFFYLYRGTYFEGSPTIYHVLSFDALGAFYSEKGEIEKAKTFHNKAIHLLDKYALTIPSIGYKIFYNTAHFYSTIKEHKKSLEFCLKGIELNQKNHTTYCLEQLYYELGYNNFCLNKAYQQDYLLAYALAIHMKNKKLKENILKDNQQYQLDLSFV